MATMVAEKRLQYWSIERKKELRQKATISIYWSAYVPTLTYSHELWVVSESIRSWIQAANMSFLLRVAGPSHGDRVKSLVSQEGLRVEQLLLHINRGHIVTH